MEFVTCHIIKKKAGSLFKFTHTHTHIEKI